MYSSLNTKRFKKPLLHKRFLLVQQLCHYAFLKNVTIFRRFSALVMTYRWIDVSFFIDAATRFGHTNTRIYIKQSNCVKSSLLSIFEMTYSIRNSRAQCTQTDMCCFGYPVSDCAVERLISVLSLPMKTFLQHFFFTQIVINWKDYFPYIYWQFSLGFTGWCCLVCPLNTDTMNLWNEDKNHGIRQHDTLMQDMTFSCHLIFQHSAVVQFENNLGVHQFWHRSIFLFHLTLSHSSVYEVCSPLFFGNDQYIHIL